MRTKKPTSFSIGVIVNPFKHALQELKKEAESRNITFEQIPYTLLPISELESSDWFQNLLQYDALLFRGGMRDTVESQVAHLLQQQGRVVINASTKHQQAHRKIQQAMLCDLYNISHPRSIWGVPDTYETIQNLLGDTFVVKPDVGSQGTGVALIESARDLESYQSHTDLSHCLFQEQIIDADEYRVYTTGAIGIASYKKIPNAKDFRANLHTNASVERTESDIRDRLHIFAGSVAEKFGADISGIDVLVKDDEFILLELNWQPGWRWIDHVVDENIPEMMIDYIIKRAEAFYHKK